MNTKHKVAIGVLAEARKALDAQRAKAFKVTRQFIVERPN